MLHLMLFASMLFVEKLPMMNLDSSFGFLFTACVIKVVVSLC